MNASPELAEQISIFLENRSGQLVHIVNLLGHAGINIRALSLADTSDFGILRLIVSNPDKAAKLIKSSGFTVGRSAIVAVEIGDSPGSLAKTLELVSKSGINVEYMYACARRQSQLAVIIFRFDRTDEAMELLYENGYHIIPAIELYQL